jgi:hypothetical protein
MRLGSDGEVNSNLSSVEVDAAQVVDALLSLVNVGHGHKAEASRSVGLRKSLVSSK